MKKYRYFSINDAITINEDVNLAFVAVMLGTVHTGVEVCGMDSEMSRLVEWPWLQLIYCAVCLSAVWLQLQIMAK